MSIPDNGAPAPASDAPASDATPTPDASTTDSGIDPAEQERLDNLINETLGDDIKPPVTPTAPEVPEDTPTEDEPTPDEPAKDEPKPDEPKEDEPKPEPKKDEPKPDDKPDEPDTIEVEDAEGNKYQIAKVEDLPEDFEPKNNRQIFEILAKLNKLEADSAEKAAEDAKAAEAAEAVQRQEATLAGWDNEMVALQEEGLLDKPKIMPGEKGWEKDPANIKAESVFKFMTEENPKRMAEGKAPITSFAAALSMVNAREQKAAAAQAVKDENKDAKAKAALIGGGAATSAGGAETYRAGSAKSIDDIVV